MPDLRREIAELICHGDVILSPEKWLDEEAKDLAAQIPHLDEIPSQAILPLAILVAGGESDAEKLARAIDIDTDILDEYLDALCEFKFAQETWNGYKSTPAGEQAFDAIGRRMVERELSQLKSRLEKLKQLDKQIYDSLTSKPSILKLSMTAIRNPF
jgi:hypothetical protein